MIGRFCIIDGRRYRVGDVVVDWTGKAPPVVKLHDADPVLWRWFVVRTNPNCDERAVASLAGIAVKVFRPVERSLVERHRRKVEVDRSLFPRYLFVGLPAIWRRDVDFAGPAKCDGVEGFVRVAGSPAEINQEVIQAMQDAQQGGEFDHTRQIEGLPVGSTVKIKEGPLAGFLATIDKWEPDKRIEVLLHMFGRQQRLRFGVGELEVVP